MEDIHLQDLEVRLKYFQTVLQYLDCSGNLRLIKAQCDKYKKRTVLVYTFKLLIDVPDLCESDADLGSFLMQKPLEAVHVFQEVIYKTVLVLELLPGETSLSQIAVILRLSALPWLDRVNVIKSVPCLSRIYKTETFCVLVGTVIGLSAVAKYTQSTQYFCPEEDCMGHTGHHYIRVHTSGASEAQTIRRDFKCKFCCSILIEEKSKRTLSEKVVAEVMPTETMARLHGQSGHKTKGQAIPVVIRDDLTKIVRLGETIDICGTVRKDVLDNKIILMLEANNVQKVKQHVSAKRFLQDMPRNILRLYQDRKCSPWSFVLTLAYYFGGEVCPCGTYFSLKLAMLLSLMSQLDKKVKPLHLLAVGGDTEILSRLLQFGQRFLDRSSVLSEGHQLGGHVTVDKYNSAEYFVEGGALQTAQDGVCYIGDIHRLKKSTTNCLQSILTGQKVSTAVTSKFTGGLPQHLEHALKSRVWGYTDPSAGRKNVHVSNEMFVGYSTGDLSKTLLESFSLLCFTDCVDCYTREDTDAQMLEQTLVAAMMPDQSTPDVLITASDFSQFVKFAVKLRPVFCDEAERLIHSYYLACRKSRSTDTINVPPSADQTLLSLAYCHAKLALNTKVTLADALLAIKIFEESLTARFGLSALNVQPTPHLTRSSAEQYLGPENDHQMQRFHSNVKRFCRFAGGMEE